MKSRHLLGQLIFIISLYLYYLFLSHPLYFSISVYCFCPKRTRKKTLFQILSTFGCSNIITPLVMNLLLTLNKIFSWYCNMRINTKLKLMMNPKFSSILWIVAQGKGRGNGSSFNYSNN